MSAQAPWVDYIGRLCLVLSCCLTDVMRVYCAPTTVENRMNTRHTRNNAKGAIEDPWLAQTTGSKTNGNSKRPLCKFHTIYGIYVAV